MLCFFQPEICDFWATHIQPYTEKKKKNGGIYLYPTQGKKIIHMIRDLKLKYDNVHVCESGFGSGHFTSMMLLQNHTSVTVFDMFAMDHQRKIRNNIANRFQKVRFIEGDSYDTLQSVNIRPCHLIHISIPHRERFDLYNFRKHSFTDTLITFTSLNKHFQLYKSILPMARDIGFISNFSCENVENVPQSHHLFMSATEREDQIHCWSTYTKTEFGSNTYEEFIDRILQSRSGRGTVAITNGNDFSFRSNEFTNVPSEIVSRKYKHKISQDMSEDWILLWIHHFTTSNFCETVQSFLQTKVITYMLIYISDSESLQCLLNLNLKVYSLMKYGLNEQFTKSDDFNLFVFATFGNDLPIPYKFTHVNPNTMNLICEGEDSTPTFIPHFHKQNFKLNKKLIVILLDAISNKVFKTKFPKTISTLRKKNVKQVNDYAANDQYSGPNR